MEILNELIIKQIEFQKSLDAVNKKLDEQAQKKPAIQLDHQAIASQIRAGLPSPEQFQKVSDQIRSTVSNIPTKIPVETADQILGFTNFKALLIHYGVFLSLTILVGVGITYSKNQEIEELQTYQRNAKQFISWIQNKYPDVWRVWNK